MAPQGKESMTVGSSRRSGVIRMHYFMLLLFCLVSTASCQGDELPGRRDLETPRNNKTGIASPTRGTPGEQGGKPHSPEIIWTTRPDDSFLSGSTIEPKIDSKTPKSNDNVTNRVTQPSISASIPPASKSVPTSDVMTSDLGVPTEEFSSGEGEDLGTFIPITPVNVSKTSAKTTKIPTSTIQYIDDSLLIKETSTVPTKPPLISSSNTHSITTVLDTKTTEKPKSSTLSSINSEASTKTSTVITTMDTNKDVVNSTSRLISTERTKTSGKIEIMPTIPSTTSKDDESLEIIIEEGDQETSTRSAVSSTTTPKTTGDENGLSSAKPSNITVRGSKPTSEGTTHSGLITDKGRTPQDTEQPAGRTTLSDSKPTIETATDSAQGMSQSQSTSSSSLSSTSPKVLATADRSIDALGSTDSLGLSKTTMKEREQGEVKSSTPSLLPNLVSERPVSVQSGNPSTGETPKPTSEVVSKYEASKSVPLSSTLMPSSEKTTESPSTSQATKMTTKVEAEGSAATKSTITPLSSTKETIPTSDSVVHYSTLKTKETPGFTESTTRSTGAPVSPAAPNVTKTDINRQDLSTTSPTSTTSVASTSKTKATIPIVYEPEDNSSNTTASTVISLGSSEKPADTSRPTVSSVTMSGASRTPTDPTGSTDSFSSTSEPTVVPVLSSKASTTAVPSSTLSTAATSETINQHVTTLSSESTVHKLRLSTEETPDMQGSPSSMPDRETATLNTGSISNTATKSMSKESTVSTLKATEISRSEPSVPAGIGSTNPDMSKPTSSSPSVHMSTDSAGTTPVSTIKVTNTSGSPAGSLAGAGSTLSSGTTLESSSIPIFKTIPSESSVAIPGSTFKVTEISGLGGADSSSTLTAEMSTPSSAPGSRSTQSSFATSQSTVKGSDMPGPAVSATIHAKSTLSTVATSEGVKSTPIKPMSTESIGIAPESTFRTTEKSGTTTSLDQGSTMHDTATSGSTHRSVAISGSTEPSYSEASIGVPPSPGPKYVSTVGTVPGSASTASAGPSYISDKSTMTLSMLLKSSVGTTQTIEPKTDISGSTTSSTGISRGPTVGTILTSKTISESSVSTTPSSRQETSEVSMESKVSSSQTGITRPSTYLMSTSSTSIKPTTAEVIGAKTPNLSIGGTDGAEASSRSPSVTHMNNATTETVRHTSEKVEVIIPEVDVGLGGSPEDSRTASTAVTSTATSSKSTRKITPSSASKTPTTTATYIEKNTQPSTVETTLSIIYEEQTENVTKEFLSGSTSVIGASETKTTLSSVPPIMISSSSTSTSTSPSHEKPMADSPRSTVSTSARVETKRPEKTTSPIKVTVSTAKDTSDIIWQGSGEGSGSIDDMLPGSSTTLSTGPVRSSSVPGSTTGGFDHSLSKDVSGSTTPLVSRSTIATSTKYFMPDLGKPPTTIENDTRVVENATTKVSTIEPPSSSVRSITDLSSVVTVESSKPTIIPEKTLPNTPVSSTLMSGVVNGTTTAVPVDMKTSPSEPPSSSSVGMLGTASHNFTKVPGIDGRSSPAMPTSTTLIMNVTSSVASTVEYVEIPDLNETMTSKMPDDGVKLSTLLSAISSTTSIVPNITESSTSKGKGLGNATSASTSMSTSTLSPKSTAPPSTKVSSTKATTQTTLSLSTTSSSTGISSSASRPTSTTKTSSVSPISSTTTESDIIFIPDNTDSNRSSASITSSVSSPTSQSTLKPIFTTTSSTTETKPETTNKSTTTVVTSPVIGSEKTTITKSPPTTSRTTIRSSTTIPPTTTIQVTSRLSTTIQKTTTSPTTTVSLGSTIKESTMGPTSTLSSSTKITTSTTSSPTTTTRTSASTPTSSTTESEIIFVPDVTDSTTISSTTNPSTTSPSTTSPTTTNPSITSPTTTNPSTTSPTTTNPSTTNPSTTTIPTSTTPMSTRPPTTTIPITTTSPKMTSRTTTKAETTTITSTGTTTSTSFVKTPSTPGATSGQTTTTSTDTTTQVQPTVVRTEIRIVGGADFSEELKDPRSSEFNKLRSSVNKSVTETLVKGGLDANRFRLKNYQFTEGSVIVSFDVESTTNATLPAQAVEQSFKKAAADGRMGNFTVDLTTLSFVDVKVLSTEWPPLVQDPAPVMTKYSFPDWAIGVVLAAGILFVFVILAGIVVCCVSSSSTNRHEQLRYSANMNEQPSPSTSDGGSHKDASSFQGGTLSKQEPDPAAGVHTYITLPVQGKPAPRNSVQENGKAPPIPPPPPKLPGEANNGIGEVVDLSSIYIVDELRPVAPNSNRDQLVISLQNKDEVDSAPVEKRVVSFSYPSDPYVRSFYDNESETWDTYM